MTKLELQNMFVKNEPRDEQSPALVMLSRNLVVKLEKIAETCDDAKVEVVRLLEQLQKIVGIRKGTQAATDIMFKQAEEIQKTVNNLETICDALPETAKELQALRVELGNLLIPQYANRLGLAVGKGEPVEKEKV